MMEWPDWWFWELELSPHLLKRMTDRQFSEADLRIMLESASAYQHSYEKERWIVRTTHEGRAREIIVEPDPDDKVLVVVTAYPVD